MSQAAVHEGRLATGRPQARPKARSRGVPRAPAYVFWMLVVFLVLEYARPPVIVQLKLQFLISLVLPFLWLGLRKRPWSSILTAQALFIVWCAKSIPLAYNYYSTYFVTRTMYGNVSIALALTWVCSNLRDLRRILWIWVALMTYQGVWSLTHGGTGTGGFLGDENDLALACGTAVPLAFFGFERLRGRARIGCGLALVILISGIVVSLSRGGFLGLAMAGSYCLYKSRHKLRAIGVVAVAVVAVPIFAPPSYIDEIRSIQETDSGTAKGRFFLWESATNMFLANPLLGVGAGNSTYHIGKYQPTDYEEKEYQLRDWSGTTVHSMYFQILPEHGVVGVLLIAFLVWRHFVNTRRVARLCRSRRVPPGLRRDAELYAFGLNGALLGFLTAGAFVSVAYYPYLWYFTALSAALELAVRRELARLEGAPRRQPAGERRSQPA